MQIIDYSTECNSAPSWGNPDGSGIGSGGGLGGDPNDDSNDDQNNPDNSNGNDGFQDCLYDDAGQCVGEVTSPVLPALPVAVSPLTNDFFDTLEVDEKIFINNSNEDELRRLIDSFLLEQNHNEQAKDFAKEAIKAKMEDEDAEVDFPNKSIYDPSVPECLKDVIDKFKPTENFNVDVSGFDNALQQQLNIAGQTLALFDNEGDYGIKFDVKVLVGANAQTVPQFKTIDGNRIFTGVEISFHEGYVAKATDLGLARSTVHELIHAYLLYATYAENPTTLGETMDLLLDQFDIGPAHHGLMSRQFAGAISGALQSWDNYSNPSQEYDYLSWSGAMISSEEFRNLSSDYQNAVWERMYAEEGRFFPLNSSLIDTPALGERNCN